jgi:gamma-tubulin complex component 3
MRTILCKPEYEHEWHQVRVVMAEMIHFLRQMQAFSQLEVIACHWEILVEFLAKKEGDLDALIEAHRTYLDHVVKKVLLLHPKTGKEVGSSDYFSSYSHVLTPLVIGEYPDPSSRSL